MGKRNGRKVTEVIIDIDLGASRGNEEMPPPH